MTHVREVLSRRDSSRTAVFSKNRRVTSDRHSALFGFGSEYAPTTPADPVVRKARRYTGFLDVKIVFVNRTDMPLCSANGFDNIDNRHKYLCKLMSEFVLRARVNGIITVSGGLSSVFELSSGHHRRTFGVTTVRLQK